MGRLVRSVNVLVVRCPGYCFRRAVMWMSPLLQWVSLSARH